MPNLIDLLLISEKAKGKSKPKPMMGMVAVKPKPKPEDRGRVLINALVTAMRSKKDIAVQAQAGHAGVMVAFYLDTFSPDAAVQLQVPGGETWDALHLTLSYLGDSTMMGSDAESKLYQLISNFAANQQPLEGTISGIGLFNNTEEGDSNAFYASFDSPGLPGFRQQLMDLLQSNGLMPVQTHGFTPHITLAYVPKGQPLPEIELPSMPMIFNKVTVKWGDKRTDFTLGMVTREIKEQITEKASARLPFTVFKDAKGQWRWIGISSSAAKDADGETVSRKALEADTASKDVWRDYGPLNWWHTPIELGTCDFNAMDGPLLVESGTFKSEAVAQAVAKAIADGTLNPGMSLEFEHNEPGPPVLPGRVFTRINKVGRALLPAEKASNLLTSFKVYSLKSASTAPAGDANKKESKKMLTEEKYKKLESILPPELLEGLLSGNEVAVKSAELAGYSFKAMTPAIEKPVVNAAQMPVDPMKKKLDTKAGPGGMLVEGSPEEEAMESPEEEAAEDAGAFEDSPADDAADAIMQALYDQIDQIVQTRLEAASKDILAALSGVSAAATATKEVSDIMAAQTIALKENTTALNTVVAENKSLKARLDALEGNQPAGIRARVTQGQGLTAAELNPVHKEMVDPAQREVDPYAKIITELGLSMAPRG